MPLEFGTDGVALAGHSNNSPNNAARGRSDVGGGFRRFDFHHVLIGFDLVADFDVYADDGGFGDRFAKLREDDWNKRHIRVEVNFGRPRRWNARWGDGSPRDLGGMEWECPSRSGVGAERRRHACPRPW